VNLYGHCLLACIRAETVLLWCSSHRQAALHNQADSERHVTEHEPPRGDEAVLYHGESALGRSHVVVRLA
jgi:hypothetical protein